MPPSSDPPGVAGGALRASGVVAGPHRGVDELLLEARFVDHHVHGILRGTIAPDQLIRQLSESDRPAAAAVAGMDTQLGIAVRRWTAPLLGLEPGVPAAAWLAHRSGLDNESVGRSLLPEAGFDALLVDTGYVGTTLTSPDELGTLAGVPAREVVRLEVVAETVAERRPSPAAWWDALRAELAVRTRDAVGIKSILAYRYGFDVDPAPPSDAEVAAAAGRWFAELDAGAPMRLADPTLLRAVVWAGVELGLPLQFHTGYGDSDLDLHRADPALLTGFLRLTQDRCPVLLLHTYPFQRTAGYLAQMFPHVYLDVGLGVNHSGAASGQIIRETLEIAPVTKVLFSSDAWGLPELHVLGSWLIRRGLSRIVGTWVRDGDWTLADAARAIELFAGVNARRVYTRL
jgi:predicted TIM-barrel fold metal-dependent hydrolase